MVARVVARQAGQRLPMPPPIAPSRDVRDHTIVHLSPRPIQVGCGRCGPPSPREDVSRASKGEQRVSVEKSIDLTATGPTIEQAVEEAVSRARLTLQGVSSFEIERIEGLVGDEDISYRVLVRVSFLVKEHVHE
jgi:flavin-binding protein dodecin